jgi:hypothetical protein
VQLPTGKHLKNFISLIIFLVVFSLQVLCQGSAKYSIGNSYWVEASFADTSNGWIVGDTSLMRTTDGGKTWTIVNTPSSIRL